MSQPYLTAWTFEFVTRTDGRIVRATVETPTRLGHEHACRCARFSASRIGGGTDVNPLSGRLVAKRSSAQYRKEQNEAVADALRTLHSSLSARSASDPVARYPGEPTYRR